MIGIYKVTNLLNNKIYIGKSVNIEKRWQSHKDDSLCSEKRWQENKRHEQTYFHRAIRKYGIDNFKWEIIEECSLEELSEKEQYYIKIYDSMNLGYNMTPGGDGQSEIRYSTKISQEECDLIIELLYQHKTYEEIKQIIPTATTAIIHSINYGKSWYNPNLQYPISIDNGHRKWTDEEAMNIKQQYSEGATISELSKKYNCYIGTIADLIYGKSYTNLPILKRKVDYLRKSDSREFNKEEVRFYRTRNKNGESILSLYKEVKDRISYAGFRNMIKGITYKDVEL